MILAENQADIGQCNLIKNSKRNTHIYRHLIFDKEATTIQWEKKENIFNKCSWSNCCSAHRRMEIDPYLSQCTKFKTKWNEDQTSNLIY